MNGIFEWMASFAIRLDRERTVITDSFDVLGFGRTCEASASTVWKCVWRKSIVIHHSITSRVGELLPSAKFAPSKLTKSKDSQIVVG